MKKHFSLLIRRAAPVCLLFLALLAVGMIAAYAQGSSSAPKPMQTPKRADCGGKNQPPCEPPACGDLNGDCCPKPQQACRQGLVCRSGACVSSQPPCGALGQA